MNLLVLERQITKSTKSEIKLNIELKRQNSQAIRSITFLPPQGFGSEAPAYACKECVKYWCSMPVNPDLMKLGAHGGLGVEGRVSPVKNTLLLQYGLHYDFSAIKQIRIKIAVNSNVNQIANAFKDPKDGF